MFWFDLCGMGWPFSAYKQTSQVIPFLNGVKAVSFAVYTT
ncbi:MAG: hypothetical protein UW41_C0006G0027 [Candidatus Collierbacteria bacterium GW2011_GWC2_44_18]|uniref:Uncharacterized protein n=1 Tax=Candidatus Collierbacteria bacterium GW2011_GWC2_44_18 TaxID=1618392 RepID=A0A0G1KNB2_9BACT|nr:MAG: hypothetical protein UW41_C0006G0027 [Candidatus Collierbacteria bacterium GW2011_GWC2_44_18]